MFKFLIGAVALTTFSAAAPMVLAQDAPPPGPGAPAPAARAARPFVPVAVHQVKPGLYRVFGNGGTVTVRVADDGLIVVDTKLGGDNYYQDLMEKIRSVSDKPIKYVFITHVHNDHSGNAARFQAAGAKTIASDDYKKLVATYKLHVGDPRSPAPDISFAKTYTVKLKGATATAYALHPAHTASDSVVYFPDEKVVAAGDNMFPSAPNVDWENGGSLMGMKQNWAELAKLDFDTLIPGHGDAIVSRAEFEADRTKLDTLIERLRAAVKAGVPKSELLATLKVDDLGAGWDLRKFHDWTDPGRLDGLYVEFAK
ncbi:MAG TPA: MBL fold metallo-hydrolase [Caulobacteraceae bacterium]|jgi:glyoxylase-like metal-dependent hydrolase (beta-lactamase superfamily II)|nr:MBL fold metallo-hydrolase [Caulobacteraceae bacterium]